MADNGYILREPERLHIFPQAIASEAVKHFLDGLIPLILKCTESGGAELVGFERGENGEFFMLFEMDTGEFRAITSGSPDWVALAEEKLAGLSGERDLSDSLPRTDFENIEPSDIESS